MIYAKASKPALMVARTPEKDFKYYWIKVGISNFDQFRTTFDFYVDAKTLKIYYANFASDWNKLPAMLTLEQWRRARKTSKTIP